MTDWLTLRWKTLLVRALVGVGFGVLALAWPDGESAVYEGTVGGSLTWPPRGDRGFGYDPVFVATGMGETFAQIAPEEKHRISHRADAFAKLVKDQFGG